MWQLECATNVETLRGVECHLPRASFNRITSSPPFGSYLCHPHPIPNPSNTHFLVWFRHPQFFFRWDQQLLWLRLINLLSSFCVPPTIFVGILSLWEFLSTGSFFPLGAVYLWELLHCEGGTLLPVAGKPNSASAFPNMFLQRTILFQMGHLGQEKHSIVCTHQMILQMLFLLWKLFARPSFLPWTCG